MYQFDCLLKIAIVIIVNAVCQTCKSSIIDLKIHLAERILLPVSYITIFFMG